MINKVILIGNLGHDPEVHTSSSGSIVTQISIATTRRVKQQDGSYGDDVEWHRVVCFGKTAEVARDYLTKGRQVYVEGRLKTRKYVDKQGVEKYVTDVIGENFQMLGRRDDEQQGGTAPAQTRQQSHQAAPATPAYDDDTPF